MFWSKKKKNNKHKISLGMVILEDSVCFKKDALFNDLAENYELKPEEVSGDDTALSFKVKNELIALAFIPVAIPWGDIEETAKYAYNWPKPKAMSRTKSPPETLRRNEHTAAGMERHV